MEYVQIYLDFIEKFLLNQEIYIPEILFIPVVIIFHILILFLIYFIHRKFKKRWRVKASYKYLKKISKIEGEHEFQKTIAYLRKIDPFIFEEMILSMLKKQGYKIYRNKRYTGDGGIDGKFKYNRNMYYIQAKRYKNHITKSHVEDFNKIVNKKRARGLFVHTGRTGKGSRNAICKNVTFLSGNSLVMFLKNKKDISEVV